MQGTPRLRLSFYLETETRYPSSAVSALHLNYKLQFAEMTTEMRYASIAKQSLNFPLGDDQVYASFSAPVSHFGGAGSLVREK